MGMAVPDVTGAGRAVFDDARFTSISPPPPPAALAVVGQVWAPDQLPDQMITITPDRVGYQDLFTGLDPNGAPARVRYGGTYGTVVGAMMRRV